MNIIARTSLIAIILAAPFAATPALAQEDIVYAAGTGDTYDQQDYVDQDYSDRDYSDHSTDRIAAKMSDPATQDRVSGMVEGITAAVMDLPVGQFAAAMDRAVPGSVDHRRIHPDDRLGDIAGGNSRYLPEAMGARTRSAMSAASGFAEMFSAMLPEFKRLGREMADRVDASIDESRSRRD